MSEDARLTDADLTDIDQWAACDLGDTEGRQVAALVDEVRSLRSALKEACDIAARVIGDSQVLPSTDANRVAALRDRADGDRRGR